MNSSFSRKLFKALPLVKKALIAYVAVGMLIAVPALSLMHDSHPRNLMEFKEGYPDFTFGGFFTDISTVEVLCYHVTCFAMLGTVLISVIAGIYAFWLLAWEAGDIDYTGKELCTHATVAILLTSGQIALVALIIAAAIFLQKALFALGPDLLKELGRARARYPGYVYDLCKSVNNHHVLTCLISVGTGAFAGLLIKSMSVQGLLVGATGGLYFAGILVVLAHLAPKLSCVHPREV